MAYLFNSIDLATYGIQASRMTGSTIPLRGCFNLPERIGKTYHNWGDEDGVEPYVLDEEIFFGGRDIEFIGVMTGTRSEISTGLKDFNAAASAVSGTNVLSTPLGNFNTYVKNTNINMYPSGAEIKIMFREPHVNLSGGSLPATGSSGYTIDGRPFISFGLYPSDFGSGFELNTMKQQYFTKIEAEGWQNAKRNPQIYNFKATLIGTTFSNFQSKVRALYLLFSVQGLRTFVINNEITIECFAEKGFEISDVYIGNVGLNGTDIMIGRFSTNLIVTSIT